jgi:hypothetical protein
MDTRSQLLQRDEFEELADKANVIGIVESIIKGKK